MKHVRGPFPPKFRAAAGSIAFSICALAGAPALAQQAIYKWVDERGVVNYGNTDVPKNITVSLIDTAPPVAAIQPQSTALPGDAEALREQLAKSQEEVARLHATAGAQVAARKAEPFEAWRQRCESDHRVDCDKETYTAELRADSLVRRPIVRQPAKALPPPLPVRPKAVSMEVNRSPKPGMNPGTKLPAISLQ